MKYCNSISDIPKTAHLAVLQFDTITIPGDERSRTCPGHGYPEHSETAAKYIIFNDETELKKWVATELSHSYHKEFIILSSTPRPHQANLVVTF